MDVLCVGVNCSCPLLATVGSSQFYYWYDRMKNENYHFYLFLRGWLDLSVCGCCFPTNLPMMVMLGRGLTRVRRRRVV